VVDTLCNLGNFFYRNAGFTKVYLFPVACHLDIPLRGAYGRSFDEGKIGFMGELAGA